MKDKIEIKTDEYGTKSYYKNGKYHRKDGPAMEYNDGDKDRLKENVQEDVSNFLPHICLDVNLFFD